MQKRNHGVLTDTERAYLHALLANEKVSPLVQTHARILLMGEQAPAGPGWTDAQISATLEVSRATVAHVRRMLVESGLDTALAPLERPLQQPAGQASAWTVVNTARDLWRRFAVAARALPNPVWIRWLRTLFAGLALTCLVGLGLTLGVRWAAPRGLQAWDAATLAVILERAPMSFARGIVFETPGNLVGMALLIGAVVVLAIYAGRPLVVASILSAYSLGSAVFWVGWGLWNRARPDVVADGIAAPGLHAFPSGHMVHVTAIYGYLTFLWWQASRSMVERLVATGLFALLVAVVGMARLVLGTHWPSDIIAGALLGLLWALTLATAQRVAMKQ